MNTACFFGTREDGMYAATYEITNNCNLSCKHCMNKSNKISHEGLSVENAKMLIDEMYEHGVRSLYISGGEPLTYPNIDLILQYSYEKGIKVSLATNGILVPEHLEAIVKYVTDVSISIDGIGEIHDEFRGLTGMFDKVSNALECLRRKVNLIVSTVIWKGNLESLKDIVAFAYQKGVNQINFSFLVPVGRGEQNDLHIATKDYSRACKEIETLRKDYSNKNLVIVFRRSSRISHFSKECAGGTLIMHATSNGRIAPCSWCSKLGEEYAERFTYQWKPGNMNKCMSKSRNLEKINYNRKNKFGYSGCPAMAVVYYQNIECDDPLNELL